MSEKVILVLVLVLILVCSVTACNKNSTKCPKLENSGIEHELEFGGIYIKSTISNFNALGFKYGDSINIKFSNGYTLEDIPYYNGYYTLNGEKILVAYPGYPYIRLGINNGDDLWPIAGVTDTDTATVTLNTAAKYIDVQNARDIHYSDEKGADQSDASFANFRCVTVGNLKANTFYRSASPCDNQHNRAGYVNTLIEAAGIQYILNLADTQSKIDGYMSEEGFNTRSSYFLTLYNADKVNLMGLNTNFESEGFKNKLITGLRGMIDNEGPYLIHCTEGKDRTGFVCILLEALAGASYQEIVDDYMITYDNYYGITSTSDSSRYNTIVETVFDPMVQIIVGNGANIKTANLAVGARSFLQGAGLNEAEITSIYNRIANDD